MRANRQPIRVRASDTQRMDDRAIEEALRLGGDHEAADRVAARRAKATIIPPPRGSDPQGAA